MAQVRQGARTSRGSRLCWTTVFPPTHGRTTVFPPTRGRTTVFPPTRGRTRTVGSGASATRDAIGGPSRVRAVRGCSGSRHPRGPPVAAAAADRTRPPVTGPAPRIPRQWPWRRRFRDRTGVPITGARPLHVPLRRSAGRGRCSNRSARRRRSRAVTAAGAGGVPRRASAGFPGAGTSGAPASGRDPARCRRRVGERVQLGQPWSRQAVVEHAGESVFVEDGLLDGRGDRVRGREGPAEVEEHPDVPVARVGRQRPRRRQPAERETRLREHRVGEQDGERVPGLRTLARHGCRAGSTSLVADTSARCGATGADRVRSPAR